MIMSEKVFFPLKRESITWEEKKRRKVSKEMPYVPFSMVLI